MFCSFCRKNNACKKGACDTCGDYVSCLVDTEYKSDYTDEVSTLNVCAVCFAEKESENLEDE